MKLNCGAKRHPYSMFNVGRSMLDVHLFVKCTLQDWKLTSDTLIRRITRSRANPAYNRVPYLEKAKENLHPVFLTV